jgi:hypothetical protein
VSYGAVEFGAVGELSDAVRRADLSMYARKRERRATTRRNQSERVEKADLSMVAAEPDSEPAGQG